MGQKIAKTHPMGKKVAKGLQMEKKTHHKVKNVEKGPHMGGSYVFGTWEEKYFNQTFKLFTAWSVCYLSTVMI